MLSIIAIIHLKTLLHFQVYFDMNLFPELYDRNEFFYKNLQENYLGEKLQVTKIVLVN